MKKVFLLATAAFLVTGFAFAQESEGKKCSKTKEGKDCCAKKEARAAKATAKATKTTAKVTTKA